MITGFIAKHVVTLYPLLYFFFFRKCDRPAVVMCNSPADLWTFKCGFECYILKRKFKCSTWRFLVDQQYRNRPCWQVASVQQFNIFFLFYGLLATDIFNFMPINWKWWAVMSFKSKIAFHLYAHDYYIRDMIISVARPKMKLGCFVFGFVQRLSKVTDIAKYFWILIPKYHSMWHQKYVV